MRSFENFSVAALRGLAVEALQSIVLQQPVHGVVKHSLIYHRLSLALNAFAWRRVLPGIGIESLSPFKSATDNRNLKF